MKVWRPKTVGSKVVAGLGVVATIIAIVLGVKALIPDPKPPRLSIVFIVDVSPAMLQHLEGQTKLAAAEDSILRLLTQRHGISTSLRLVKAGCRTEYTRATVGFSKKNLGRYRDVFENLAEQPVSTYFQALNSGADDLTSKNLIEDSPQKLLIVFMANAGAKCVSPLLLPVGSGLAMQFFWLSGSGGGIAEVRKELNELGFGEVKIQVVGSREALRAAVRHEVRTRLTTTVSTPTEPTSSTDTTTESSPTLVTVPSVIGRTRADATHQLEAAGFSPQVQLQDVAELGQQGNVLAQDPMGGSSAETGTTVKLSVGNYRPTPTTTSSPSRVTTSSPSRVTP